MESDSPYSGLLDLSSVSVQEPLATLLDESFEFADIFLESTSMLTTTASSELRGGTSSRPGISARVAALSGAGLRTVRGGNQGFAATHGVEESDLLETAARAVWSFQRDNPLPVLSPTARETRLEPEAITRLFLDELFDFCSWATAEREIRIVLNQKLTRRRVVAPDFDRTAESVRSELSVSLGDRARPFAVRAWQGWDIPDSLTAKDLAREVEGRQLADREFVSIPDGKLSIVFAAGWGGIWMHEAIGHLLESDTILKYGSPLYDQMDQQVCSVPITVRDDKSVKQGRVTYDFDDEGTDPSTTRLIENGVVRGILSDRIGAYRLDRARTGNGRRPHYGAAPMPRMTNLVLSGPAEDRELCTLVETAIEVQDISHAAYDPETGLITFDVALATLVRNGRPAGRVAPLRLRCKPLELLRRIVAVGPKPVIEPNRGYCRKGGHVMPVTVGQPEVLVRDIDVTTRNAPD